MSLPPYARRLDQLRHLRDRIDREIAQESARLARIEQTRQAKFPAQQSRPASPYTDADRPDPKVVRDWARTNGVPVGLRGRIKDDVYAAYAAAHGDA